MSKICLNIGDKEYPCYPTMGALLRFKDETGKEIAGIKTSDLSSMCVYLWCCAKSACNREGVAFDYALQDFADNINMTQLAAWAEAVSEAGDFGAEASGEEKKS